MSVHPFLFYDNLNHEVDESDAGEYTENACKIAMLHKELQWWLCSTVSCHENHDQTT